MWKDIINLISIVETENSLGDITETESQRQIFANKTSVKRTEFYQAQATGLKPESVFEIMLVDYQGEQKIKYEGENYNVIRTYQKNSEVIELICNKLITESNTDLTNLVVTTATLSPNFGGSTYAYTSTVATGVTSVTVTATCAIATEITVNGNIVQSGVASGSISLSVGVNTITIIVRKTAKPTKTYTITITRAAS